MKDARKRGVPCVKGCGRYVISQVGACKQCRTTVCRRCGKKLQQKHEGQLVHNRCQDRKVA